jgi:photosystem II stability/assembly factor-like uncharacterized protein
MGKTNHSAFNYFLLTSFLFGLTIVLSGQDIPTTSIPYLPPPIEIPQNVNYFMPQKPGSMKRNNPPLVFSTARKSPLREAWLNAGPQWEKLDQESEGGFTEDVVTVNGKIFMSRSNELWVSHDQGTSWQLQITASYLVVRGYMPNYNYGSDKHIIVSGNNILFLNQLSTDGGETWNTLTIDPATLPTYYFAPTVLTIIGTDIYMGTYYNGMLKSSDMGKTFNTINNGYPSYIWYELPTAIGVYNGQPVVATASGIYRYNGSSWSSCTGTGLPLYDGSGRPQSFYLISGFDFYNTTWIASTHAGVYFSNNFGVTWQKYDLPELAHPDNNVQGWKDWPPIFYNVDVNGDGIIVSFRDQIYQSSDGVTWMHNHLPDRFEINRIAQASSKLVASTKAGMFVSNNSGVDWHDSNTGFARMYFPIMTNFKDRAFISKAWSGLIYTGDNGNTWTTYNKGLNTLNAARVFMGEDQAFVPSRNNFIWGGASQGSEEKTFSTDFGGSWTPTNQEFPVSQIWDLKFSAQHRYVVGARNDKWVNGIFHSSDKGTSWTQVFSGITHNGYLEDQVLSLHVADDTLYAGTSFSGLYRSADNGNTWESLNNGLTLAESDLYNEQGIYFIYKIAKSGNRIYFIGEKGNGETSLYFSKNWGKNWRESDFSQVTPEGTTRNIAWYTNILLNDDQVVVQATFYNNASGITESALLTSEDGETWEQFGPAFPDGFASSFAKVGSYLYAGGGYKGGLYRIPLYEDVFTLYSATIEADQQNVVDVPVKANSFLKILSCQFTVSWDPSVLTFEGTSDYSISGIDANAFGVDLVSDGNLIFSWNSENLEPWSAPDSTVLFNIQFKLTGAPGTSSQVLLSGKSIPIEIIGDNYLEKKYLSFPGEVFISSESQVHGTIKHRTTPLSDVEVTGRTADGSETLVAVTDASGTYSFVSSPMHHYSVDPAKTSGDYLQYLNEADAARIRRHILLTDPITDSRNMIAADVNQSMSITTLDILHLEAVLLGIKTELPEGAQWKFIASDFQFDPDHPLIYTTGKRITSSDGEPVDFAAIHLGDVVDSNASSGRTELQQTEFIISNASTNANEIILAVTNKETLKVSAFQAEFSWNDALEYQAIQNKALEVRSHEVNNNLRLIWDDESANTRTIEPGTTLFALHFKVRSRVSELQESIWLNSRFIPQVYDHALRSSPIFITWRDDKNDSDQLTIKDPYPNPFNDRIVLSVTLPESAVIDISIFDLAGKRLMNSTVYGEAGLNEFSQEVSRETPLSQGLYMLQIAVGKFTKRVKIVHK